MTGTSKDKFAVTKAILHSVSMHAKTVSMFGKDIGNLIFLNYLEEETLHVGNRFMVYAMFPQCNISIHQTWGHDRKKIVFSCGKSIFDRSAKTNVGELMLEYGGGGHVAAGTCQIEPNMADTVKQALIQKITNDG